MGYCAETDVERYLQFDIAADSTPNSTEVAEFIAIADEYVDLVTQRSWSEVTIGDTTYEYHDSDGDRIFILDNFPITSLDKCEVNTAGLGATANWVTRSKGYDKDFLVYECEGEVEFHDNIPEVGRQNVRFQYKHGCTTTPKHIKKLSTILTAIQVVLSVLAPEVLDNLRGFSAMDLKVFKHGVHPKVQSMWNEFKTLLRMHGGVLPVIDIG